ncbi:MAG: HAMP domain-containing protein [Oleispira sp.]|nr:HAMP domain-containing protein [Oleispira sp.]
MRVQYKLFAITLLASLILVTAMLLLAQWSFDRGLLEHVNKRALQQYNSLSEQLVSHYQQQGNWQALSASRASWMQLQQDAGIDIDPREMQRARQEGSDKSQNHSRPPRDHFSQHRPPPRHVRNERPRHFGNRPPRKNEPRDWPPPRKDDKPGPGNKQPLALLDVNKEPVVGFLAKPEHRQYLPLYSVGDKLIGYITYANRDRLMDDYDLDLSAQLSSNLWWIAALMILLSASLALPFSRLLLRPLRPIVESIHTLAKGDFSQRISAVNNDEIGRVAKDINHLAQQLEEIDSSRKNWLANISHELRTPLAVMRGELEAMLDGIRALNKENVASAHQEALHLQRLVEDLYQLTSSELGNNDVAQMSYQKQELDFAALVEDNLERFQPLLDKAGLSFSFNNHIEQQGGEAWLNGDASRLSQLIHNLVNNSIKYTHSPGMLVADLTIKHEVIIFTLMDSTPSVKEAELEKIFDHLYRAEQSRNRKTGGSGLGLAICKTIAESHGGELSASLSDLGGIKMILCLPRLVD